MKCVVLGSGSWGTALAQVLCDNANDVVLWGRNTAEVDDINVNHRNSKYFPDVKVNEKLAATNDLSAVRGADLILLAVPSSAMEAVLKETVSYLDHPVLFVNAAKGFHPTTHSLLSSYIRDQVPDHLCKAVVSLIGPSHAEEVILRQLTALNAVSADEEAARTVQKLFSNSYFRVYTNTDVIGAETGVAVKNIMAIAAGILCGLGQGDNARAALVTRGLAEMTRFGTACGGKAETFLGLDGVGDLMVTCTSMHSRNFQAGLAIGRSRNAAKFLRNNTKTVEGIAACRIVHAEAARMGVSMPITDAVYAVLFENASVDQTIDALMHRRLKAEF